ncbi:hypothetical protein C0993_006579 [Termitomyces sp. T159_Od127]|nr:hypothetical protein C0993_006579 [Termitomyces sp. T159_Od127]
MPRLQDLVAAMITASHHRTNTQFDCPATLYPDASLMWSIVVCSDIVKQLTTLEKVEHKEETKICHKRKERQDMATTHAAVLAAQANSGAVLSMDRYDNLKGGMKKKKKEGLGIIACNMSENIRKKMSNAIATQAMGLSRQYASMNTSNAAAAVMPTKPKTAALLMVSATLAAAVATSPNVGRTTVTLPVSTMMPMASAATSTWACLYVLMKKSTTPMAALEEDDTRTLFTM